MRTYRCLFHRRLCTTAAATAAAKERATMKWFRTVVVGEKLCPFAAPLLKQKDLLRIVSSSAQTTEDAVQDVRHEVLKLAGKDRQDTTHETTLIVFDNHHRDDSFVSSYLDFIRLSWSLQEEAISDESRDLLQLVLFHPRATHQTYGGGIDGAEGQPFDYTIRSPYPTIHLLREQDVMKAVQSGYPDLEYLPSRNKAKLSQQGLNVCRARWRACFDKDP